MTPTHRIIRDAATGLVALVAAIVSYRHQVEVALSVGEDRTVAMVLPLSVDGLMVVASMAMLADKKAGTRVRVSARMSFALGIAASVAANIAAAEPTAGARLVASWPAVALLMTIELLSRSPRPGMSADTGTVHVRPSSNGRVRPSANGKARTSRRTSAADRLAKARTANPDMPLVELARAAKVSVRHARRLLAGQEEAA